MAVGNSGDIIISQTSFYGGMGTDKKIGIKNSYADSECVDARKNPSVMTVLPASRKITGEIKGLVNAMTQSLDGVRWAIATNGILYKIDTENKVTEVAKLPQWVDGTRGDILYYQPTDTIYITGNATIYSYGKLSKTPTVNVVTPDYSRSNWLSSILTKDRNGKWVGTGTNRWTFKNGSSGSYTVKTALSEADDDKCILTADDSPIIAIEVMFRSKPLSGNVTMTIHNQLNEVVATSDVNVADIVVNTKTRFLFNQVELRSYAQEGMEYHIHLHANVSGLICDTYESGKLYGLHFWLYGALLRKTLCGVYPMIRSFTGDILIGNGRDIVSWQPSGSNKILEETFEYTRSKIFVYYGGEVTSFSTNDEYVVIGIETVGENGSRTFQSGMIAFWDCYADGANFSIETPMGAPKSLYTYQNMTYTIIDGAIYVYTGSKALTKIRTLQDSQSEFTSVADDTDMYTHCMTARRGILLMAYPSKTTLTSMRHGIYSYGSVDKDYPNSFYYSYDLPGANKYNTLTETLELGGTWNYGDTLYYSFAVHKNNTTEYAIAIVDNHSLPAKTFKYEGLMYDGGMPWKDKEALRAVASFDPLPKGCEIRLKYKINNRDWVVDTRSAKEGDTEIYFEINKRFKEVQFGIEGINTGTKTPARITSVGINVRELGEEGKMHR